ncbi:hypothetical protein COCCADRAFT_108881, partial [Bipolaris zeicola 26-R-13]
DGRPHWNPARHAVSATPRTNPHWRSWWRSCSCRCETAWGTAAANWAYHD